MKILLIITILLQAFSYSITTIDSLLYTLKTQFITHADMEAPFGFALGLDKRIYNLSSNYQINIPCYPPIIHIGSETYALKPKPQQYPNTGVLTYSYELYTGDITTFDSLHIPGDSQLSYDN